MSFCAEFHSSGGRDIINIQGAGVTAPGKFGSFDCCELATFCAQ